MLELFVNVILFCYQVQDNSTTSTMKATTSAGPSSAPRGEASHCVASTSTKSTTESRGEASTSGFTSAVGVVAIDSSRTLVAL